MLEMQATRNGRAGYQTVDNKHEEDEDLLPDNFDSYDEEDIPHRQQSYQQSRSSRNMIGRDTDSGIMDTLHSYVEQGKAYWYSLPILWQHRISYSCLAILVIFCLITFFSLTSSSHHSQASKSASSSSSSSSDGQIISAYLKPVLPVSAPVKDEEFDKSASDNRIYEGLTLPNDLEVLLISDPSTDKSSAAMCVGVGSWSDGNIAGLAHFLEHMLFMGTEKYPSETEYSDYLSSHSGVTNAYTAEDKTVFFFSVEPSAFIGAIDRFSQFFIAPLLRSDAIDREMLAVNNEHEKNLNADEWRMFELLKHTSNPAFPYSKFGTGNIKTLKVDNIRQSLVALHERHYTARNMKLVLLGRENIRELSNLAHEYFNAVPNHPYKPLEYPASSAFPAYPIGDYVSRQVFIQPIQQIHLLSLFFPLTSTTLEYKANPTRYLSFLLGDESEVSLLHWLKHKGWGTELAVGLTEDEVNLNLFQIQARLTEEGVFHYQDIIAAIFSYLDLIRKEGINKDRWKEQQELQLLAYRYVEKITAADYTAMLAARLQTIPVKDILLPPSRNIFDSALIRRILDEMTADNLIIHLASSSFADKVFNQQEPVYRTRYSSVALSTEFKKLLHSQTADSIKGISIHAANTNERIRSNYLALPRKNPYLVDPNLTLLPLERGSRDRDIGTSSSSSSPRIIRSTASQSVYYHQDDSFNKPKINLYFNFLLHEDIRISPISYTKQALWKEMVNTALQPLAFTAALAGFSYDLTVLNSGYQLKLSGYTPKMKEFSMTVVKQLIAPSSVLNDESLYSLIRDDFIDDLANFKSSLAYQQAVYELGQWMIQPAYSKDTMKDVAASLSLHNFTGFSRELFHSVMIEAYGYGDINEALMLDIVDSVCNSDRDIRAVFTLLPDSKHIDSKLIKWQRKHADTMVLPAGDWLSQHRILNEADANSAVLVHLPLAAYDDLTASVHLDLIYALLKQACFDVLRTQQQLGYIAMCFPLTLSTSSYSYRSLNVVVQGVDHTAAEMDDRILAFLSTAAGDYIQSLTAAEYTEKRQSLIKEKEKIKISMNEVSDNEWNEIMSDALLFHRSQEEVALLLAIDQSSLYDWYQHHIVNENYRRRLSIEILHRSDMTDKPVSDAAVIKSHLLDEENREEIKAGWKYWLERNK